MKKAELIPITMKEFEELGIRKKKQSKAAEIVDEFVKLNVPVMEVVDYPYKSAFVCVAAIRDYSKKNDLKVVAAQRKNRVFLLKAEEDQEA